MKAKTRVIHPHKFPVPEGNRPLLTPIYHSVKYTFDEADDFERCISGTRQGYTYTRVSNPNVAELCALLASLQGRETALLAANGVSALCACLLGLAKTGDHITMFIQSYKPSRFLVQKLLGRFGIRSTLVSIHDHEQIQTILQRERSAVMLFESPTNPTLQIADIEKLIALAREQNTVVALDNTFAGFHNHGQFEVDIFIHSLSKYATGHGDCMGGAIIGNGHIMQKLETEFHFTGTTLDPVTAVQMLRSLKTYFLRYDAQCHGAHRIAEFLESESLVSSVIYPGLPSHPQHELAKRQMRDFGTMISIELADGVNRSRFIDALSLFNLAGSLGSVESVLIPSEPAYAGDLNQQEREISGITPQTVRLSIGIEDPDDLIDDLASALTRAT